MFKKFCKKFQWHIFKSRVKFLISEAEENVFRRPGCGGQSTVEEGIIDVITALAKEFMDADVRRTGHTEGSVHVDDVLISIRRTRFWNPESGYSYSYTAHKSADGSE